MALEAMDAKYRLNIVLHIGMGIIKTDLKKSDCGYPEIGVAFYFYRFGKAARNEITFTLGYEHTTTHLPDFSAIAYCE